MNSETRTIIKVFTPLAIAVVFFVAAVLFLIPKPAHAAYDTVLDFSTATSSWSNHVLDEGGNSAGHDHNKISFRWDPKWPTQVCTFSFYLFRTSQGGTDNQFTYRMDVRTISNAITPTSPDTQGILLADHNGTGGVSVVPDVVISAIETAGTIHQLEFSISPCIDMSAANIYFFNLLYVSHTGAGTGVYSYQFVGQDFSQWTDEWIKYGDTGWTESTANELRASALGFGPECPGECPGTSPYELDVFTEPSSSSYFGNYNTAETGPISALGTMLKAIFKWIVQPTHVSTDLWLGLREKIESKAPFGYFSLVKTQLEDIATDSETVDETLWSSVSGLTSPIRTAFSWILWLLFGFWLVRRLGKISI